MTISTETCNYDRKHESKPAKLLAAQACFLAEEEREILMKDLHSCLTTIYIYVYAQEADHGTIKSDQHIINIYI